MRTIIILLALLLDFAAVSAQYNTITYNIPTGGQTVTVSPPVLLTGAYVVVGTRGPINLGSNTYTLTYSALPANGTSWTVKCDFRRLTQSASGANVTIFGVKPLQAHPTVDTFNISFSVLPDSVGTKYLYYIYNGLNDGGVINGAATFNGATRINGTLTVADSALFFGDTYLKPTSAIETGVTVVAADTGGRLTYGCAPWCITGNTGLLSTNYLGTTDTVPLRFRTNGAASGIVDYNLQNVALGYQSLLGNTTGYSNVAIGYQSMTSNSTGIFNTAVGVNSLQSTSSGSSNVANGISALSATTTGSENVGVGASAGASITTGVNNVAVGSGSLGALTTGSNNTAIGHSATVATAATSRGIAIGQGAVASSNQLTFGGVRTISIPNATTAIRYILTDTSGTGDFVPQPNPINAQTTYTPLTGDSITPTTASNLINPAGTIANFTIRLPASPYSGQLLEFSSTQIITNLLWSVALNQSVTAAATLPAAMAAGGTVKIMYNSATTTWYNW